MSVTQVPKECPECGEASVFQHRAPGEFMPPDREFSLPGYCVGCETEFPAEPLVGGGCGRDAGEVTDSARIFFLAVLTAAAFAAGFVIGSAT